VDGVDLANGSFFYRDIFVSMYGPFGSISVPVVNQDTESLA